MAVWTLERLESIRQAITDSCLRTEFEQLVAELSSQPRSLEEFFKRAIDGGALDSALLRRGGGAQIEKLGTEGRKGLTGSVVGAHMQLGIQNATVIQFEMWMLLAPAPCGAWIYAGPGSFSVVLGGNVLGCAPSTGSPCSILAWARDGAVPVWVTAN